MKNPIIFKKLASQKSICNYLKIFQNLQHFKFDALPSQNTLSGWQMELPLVKIA